MTIQESSEDKARNGAQQILRPALILAIVAIVAASVYSAVSVDNNENVGLLGQLEEWRIGLLFVSCTFAIIVFQAFFNLYFDVKIKKADLLKRLRQDQADDLAAIELFSKNAGISIPSSAAKNDPPDPASTGGG